ncbi:MAG: hypothetical protein HY791_06230 [Deltaproteobacteria bacterium]|nr:hypothetical protein [Deltaproteobacteria bacterium]
MLRIVSGSDSSLFAFGGGEPRILLPYSFDADEELVLEALVSPSSLEMLGLGTGPISTRDDASPLPNGEGFEARISDGLFSGWKGASVETLRGLNLAAPSACRRVSVSPPVTIEDFESQGYFVTEQRGGIALVGYAHGMFSVTPNLEFDRLEPDSDLGNIFAASVDGNELVLFGDQGRVWNATLDQGHLSATLSTASPSRASLRFAAAQNGEYLALTNERAVEYFDGNGWTTRYRFDGLPRDSDCGGIARIEDRVMAVGGARPIAVELDLLTGKSREWRLTESTNEEVCAIAATELGFTIGTGFGRIFVQREADREPTPLPGDSPVFPIDAIVPYPNGFIYTSGANIGEFDADFGFCPRTIFASQSLDAMGWVQSALIVLVDPNSPHPEQLETIRFE